MPRSMPTASPTTANGFALSTSTASEQNQRSASRDTVAERIRPRNFSVPSFVLILPMRGRTTPCSFTWREPVKRKLSRCPFFLNVGNPISCPCFRPRQKFRYARSQSLNASCGAHLETLYIHENWAALRLLRSLCCSMAEVNLAFPSFCSKRSIRSASA